jgi:hypothetical protein
VESNATRVCERLVGLPDVNVLAVDDQPGQPLRVHVETRRPRPACVGCGTPARVKGPPGRRARGSAVLRASGPAGVARGGARLPRLRRRSVASDRRVETLP